MKSETRESFLAAASQLMTAIVLCTCDESYQGEGEGGTLLKQNTFVECERKITISKELGSSPTGFGLSRRCKNIFNKDKLA